MRYYVVLDIETTGLSPLFGHRITCICAKDSMGNRMETINEVEHVILSEFIDWITGRCLNPLLITKNGEGFDIPFIVSRAILLDKIRDTRFSGELISLFSKLEHFDLQKVTPSRVSLDNMAKLLGCKMKSGSGLNAIKLWKEKRFSELVEYCSDDVDVTEETTLKYLQLNNLELIGNSKFGL